MPTSIGAREAAHVLGVTRATLYAYVSRGLVSRRTAVDGRTSLYDRDEIERLAGRSRRSTPGERPSIDVQISTAITRLDDAGPTIRGHPLLDLAERVTFEQIAELLMTGTLPDEPPTWPLDRVALARARAIVDAAAPLDPITTLAITTSALGDRFDADRAADAGRHLLAHAPCLLGGPMRGDMPSRLARAWNRSPSAELVAAIARALVLLADHGLATSTLAVRVAASVRTLPAAALATGFDVVAGPYHGAAGRASVALFDDAAVRGAPTAVRSRLDAGLRLPGFGHTVYRNGDPRFAPLLDSVRRIPDPDGRVAIVDEVLTEAGRSTGVLPNVDLALGALYFVGRLPPTAPIFALARVPGWVAHYDEESRERPVRFRGLATAR